MTPEDFALLGARLLLAQRLYLTPRQLAALPDHVAMAMAGALEGGTR